MAHHFAHKRIVIIVCAAFFLSYLPVGQVSSFFYLPVWAQSEADLDEVESELDEIQEEKKKYQEILESNQFKVDGYTQEISQLYAEVKVLEKEVEAFEKEIEELEKELEKKNQEIVSKQGEITETEDEIERLEFASSNIVKGNYFDFRVDGQKLELGDTFQFDTKAEYFVDTQYRELIQGDVADYVEKIEELQTELVLAKLELQEEKAKLTEETAEVVEKRTEAEDKQDELSESIETYYAEAEKLNAFIDEAERAIVVFSREEAEKRAEAERIRNELFEEEEDTSASNFVRAGDVIGFEGCTGYCTGEHLHFIVWENGGYQNPCNYVDACGTGARIFEMPVQDSFIFTSGYGDRCFLYEGVQVCGFHNGIDLAVDIAAAPIYAAHDGYLIQGYEQDTGALYAKVCQNANCQGGIVTGYWHLSRF